MGYSNINSSLKTHRKLRYIFSLLILLISSNVWAQLSLSTLEPNSIEQGQSAEFTLYGGLW